jgi:ribosome modulation factor
MATERQELRRALAARRAEERAAAEAQAAFFQGQSMALAGELEDACRARKPALRNAWLRGWQAGREQMERRALRQESPAAIAERRARLAALRESLNRGQDEQGKAPTAEIHAGSGVHVSNLLDNPAAADDGPGDSLVGAIAAAQP